MILVTFLLAACSNSANQTDPPFVTVIKDFVAALEARDPAAMIMLLEPTDWRGSIGAELRSYTANVEHIAFHDTTYEVLSSSSDSAEVRLLATLDYRIQGIETGQQDIDIVVEVVQQDGEWYIRDFALPGPVVTRTEE
jgi:hypothetical protein